MATNGWYVEQIITDLQEGKVDEFVKKKVSGLTTLKEKLQHLQTQLTLGLLVVI